MSFGLGVPFLPFYIQQLGVVDPDKIKVYTGILQAAPAITLGIMAPLWGILADKYGKKLMLVRATFCAAFIIAGMGMATRVEHLTFLRLAQGVFTGTVTASSALIASNTPESRLSYALGFLSSSTFIGMAVGPAIGGFVAEYVGYRVSFYIGAALMLFSFFLVLFFVREEKAASPSLPEGKSSYPLKQLFTVTITAMLLILLFVRISRTVFYPYIPLYVQEIRSRIEGAAGTTGIINGITGLVTAASGLTLSRLGDRYDKTLLLKILVAASIVISLPLVLINNLWAFTVIYSILFFAIGGIEPMIMSITSENTPVERRGTLFGIQTLVGSIGWAVSPFFGSMVSLKFSLKAILVLIPIFLVFAFIPIITAENLKRKSSGLSQDM